MTPSEIAAALDVLGKSPFAPNEFGYAFAEATDNAKATVSKLRTGTTNKSDLPGGVLLNKKFHYAPAEPGKADTVLAALENSKKTEKRKPAILIAVDGEYVAAKYPTTGETRHFKLTELSKNFDLFLPAAGKVRYQAAKENQVDVTAAGQLSKFYDALLRKNPTWESGDMRHEMNHFMTRLIFCMFAEDVGIFPKNQFSKAIFNHAGNNGEYTRDAIIQAFMAMNLPKGAARQHLPAWTSELEYVNGGLFAGKIEAPEFDIAAYRYLKDLCGQDWKQINPDIFGSMIQAIADPEKRAELGMHYTSVPNIMKVLGPLFLDDLDAALEKANSVASLKALHARLTRIRIFDPACGSGNFLVVAYRELRERENTLLQRLNAELGELQVEMWSAISLNNFYGIEISDFAVETARLSLYIAEYQANARFAEIFGRMPPILPLHDGGHITRDNALRMDWDTVCPPPTEGEEVYIVGNPPFVGFNSRKPCQQSDMDTVLKGRLKTYHRLDYDICWFVKAADYIRGRGFNAALVSTSSICQGATVSLLWPEILRGGVEFKFAHHPFYWSNNASDIAAVSCIIIGLSNQNICNKRIFSEGYEQSASNINAYLLDAPDIYIKSNSSSIFNLPKMDIGNIPRDKGNLILTPEERDGLIHDYPESSVYIRRFLGSKEVVRGIDRYCLWFHEDDLEAAYCIPPIAQRLENVRKFRLESDAQVTKDAASTPHRFGQISGSGEAQDHAILVPRVTSERRPYLPVDRVGADVISSDLNQVLYDAPDWCLAIIASRLHLVWIATVSGKLKADFRYSSTMGWNTFPVPNFTDDQKALLTESARAILRTRYRHYPKTIADLYDPDHMPEDLRQVHRENDDLLESMYIGHPFQNDTERLEKLFKLYAAKVAKLGK